MPGKYGDILWSLPTVRAVSETFGVPVDFLVSVDYGHHRDLLRLQPYIREVISWPSWEHHRSGCSPWSPFDEGLHYLPRELPSYDHVFHLGYRSVPDKPLPEFIYGELGKTTAGVRMCPLDLDRPWVSTGSPSSGYHSSAVAVGWSPSHASLKVEFTEFLKERFPHVAFVPIMPAIPNGDVWEQFWCFDAVRPANWVESAERVATAQFFVGCCSALYVLACAMGKSALIFEPDKARWDSTFYPYGTNGPRVLLVRANSAGAFDAVAAEAACASLLGDGRC